MSGPSLTGSFNSSHGSYAGTDFTNRTSHLSATGTAAIATSGAVLGAGASVVLNNLLKSGTTSGTGPDGKPLSQAEVTARENLATTIVGGIAAGAGLGASSAVTAAEIETANNAANGINYRRAGPTPFTAAQLASVDPRFAAVFNALGGDDVDRNNRLTAAIACASDKTCNLNQTDPLGLAAFDAWRDIAPTPSAPPTRERGPAAGRRRRGGHRAARSVGDASAFGHTFRCAARGGRRPCPAVAIDMAFGPADPAGRVVSFRAIGDHAGPAAADLAVRVLAAEI